jgi:hypothetical protein
MKRTEINITTPTNARIRRVVGFLGRVILHGW